MVLTSTSRAVQDQRNDEFALGLAITCDVTWVRTDVGHKSGGLSDECVGADTVCFGRGDVDGLTGGLSAEWTEEKGVWME